MFGGTFDPIHRGHIHVISELVQSKKFDEIWVVPAGQPRMRDEPSANPHDRFAMVELAIAALPTEISNKIMVSDIEIDRIGPSYAIETINELHSERDGEWTMVVGSDVLARLPEWHRFDELKELVKFLVIQRPGAHHDPISKTTMSFLDIDALDVSATVIREALESGVSVDEFITPEVADYIESHGLYASA